MVDEIIENEEDLKKMGMGISDDDTGDVAAIDPLDAEDPIIADDEPPSEDEELSDEAETMQLIWGAKEYEE